MDSVGASGRGPGRDTGAVGGPVRREGGPGFLTDRISPNTDGSYTGAVYVGGSQVGSFGLSR
ncbi:hypothetical protein CJ179_24835 [Rhodococcus sp. ACS1]|nr:hypothetical protein CJ179_24835 [Rhodococcus sp. ACS1]